MNILKNKPVMLIYKYSVIVFKFLNKYFYIVSLFSFILSLNNKLNENKLYRVIIKIIKIFLIINIIIGTGMLIYFTDFRNPLNNTLLFYYDEIKPYIEMVIKFKNELLNLDIEESLISNIKESNTIKDQVKIGIKEGVREALDEILNEFNAELESKTRNDLYKNLALTGSLILFGYIIFILPGSTDNLVEYNWFNQSLIELKVSVKEFISYLVSKPSDPGNDSNNIGTSNLISPQISPSHSVSSNSTITPISNLSTTPFNSGLFNRTKEIGTQTTIDGIGVSRMVETVDILSDVLNYENSNLILIKEKLYYQNIKI